MDTFDLNILLNYLMQKNAAVLESDVSRERNFQQSKSTHHRHISEHQDSTLAPEKNESSRGLQEAQTSTGVDLGEGSNFQRSSLAPANSTYLTPTMTRGRSLHLDPS
ncbi:unnamed protein product [Thelazia callipaeda]|uniref:Uncharacterized protein n=1 Tax=Thelazia callipaeda TaxID=103827 RepID=A0A0N5CME7_THECL|nr:unnamed protein product [Thelazia callipaeda]